MDWKLFFQLAATVVAALGGGWLGHTLSARRDLFNERRKLRVTYLLEAYRRLEGGSNRAEETKDAQPQIESAIADIQLLGSPRQVSLARQFTQDMATQHGASLDNLIADLRHSLRAELRLPAINESMTYLRFGKNNVASFDTTLIEAARDVAEAKVEGASLAPPENRQRLDEKENLSDGATKIDASWRQLEAMTRAALRGRNIQADDLGVDALLRLARKEGAITDAQHRSLRGLSVMRNLAVHGPPDQLDARKVREFLTLAEAMKVVLEITDGS